MPSKLTKGVAWIMAATVFFSLLAMILGDAGSDYVLWVQQCSGIDIIKLWSLPARLFTTLAPADLVSQLLLLWIFACPLETKMGTRPFCRLFFFCGLTAWISTFMFGSWNHTPWAALSGLLVAYARLFPQERVTLMLCYPVPTAWLAVAFLLIHVALAPMSWFHVGVVAGIAYVQTKPKATV